MSPIASFAIRRLVVTIPVLLAMTVLVFLIIHMVPGDPVQTMLGVYATPRNVAATRAQLGLDKPLASQYFSWLGMLVHGNLGRDLRSGVPVATLISTHLPVTLELAIASVAIGAVVGIGSGLAAATGGAVTRRVTVALSVTGISVPYFWLGIMVVLVFAGQLHWLPPSGYAPLASQPLENIRYMTLPVLTLVTGEAAYLSQVTRGIATQVLRAPSVTYLEAKGLSRSSIIVKHVLRQVSAPITTIIGIEAGVLLGGSIIVETVFGLPGLGSLVVAGVEQRDYTVIQGCVLVISVLFILATLLTDLMVGLLDPRVSHGQ
jgi:peptide/nickel transport system permease protein